jgi:hypothetical protein
MSLNTANGVRIVIQLKAPHLLYCTKNESP